jgi:peptidoglycan/xylan/chitin deacetylase (PgdA/CDA1 family)
MLAPILAGCVNGGGNRDGHKVAWSEEAPHVATEPKVTPTPPAVGASVDIPVILGEDDLVRIRPNELGRIPILMYHAFTTNEAYLDEWTITPDTFRGHLQWLHDNDFHITPLADLINNEIDVPPGKHPVVLTFDDASSGQFRLLKDDEGKLYPDPETAVGVMEEFFAAHPGMGRGGLFAVVARNCFQYDEEATTCEQRLTWLADHGYEIANHTWWHENLHTVSDDMFKEQVGRTKIWIDERVTGDANLGNVLILPFGEWPRDEGQVQMLHDGFVYDGQDIVIAGIVEVAGGPAPSPSSGEWSRRSIERFNTDPETWAHWTGLIESGAVTMYTSDGHPTRVTIPNQIPEDIAWQFDLEWAQAYGMQLIRYDIPASADHAPRNWSRRMQVVDRS